MGKGIWIFFVIVVLIVGGYFLYKYQYADKENSSELTNCNVGDMWNQNHLTYGIITGKIEGVEKVSFYNGNKIDLCCSEATNQAGQKFKVCDKEENNLITHSVLWKEENGEYLKVEESLPESGTTCTYYFDSAGEYQSRYCT